MNQYIIECDVLIDKYKLDRDKLIEQLKNLKNVGKNENFVVGYAGNSEYTLIGNINNDGCIVLTNIEKAIAFQKMDNSDLFKS